MAKFKKKPVVIEAVQLTDTTVKQAYEFMHGPVLLDGVGANYWFEYYEPSVVKNGMDITTLEDGPDGRAKHVATIGGWIIKGIQGEFYPCKPDIFKATYDPVDG